MKEQETIDFFISYNHLDNRMGRVDRLDFVPGANFIAEMHRALLRCERVVAIVSAKFDVGLRDRGVDVSVCR